MTRPAQTVAARVARHGWTTSQFALLGLLVLAAAWACLPAWQDIFRQSIRRSDAGYILLVLPVAAYLFWIRRSRAKFVRCRPSAWGTLAVLIGLTFCWYGDEVDLQVARHVGAIVTVAGAILAMTGLEALRQFGAVFLTLLFLVPVPGVFRTRIAIPLQEGATAFTDSVLNLIGVTSQRAGAVLTIHGTPIAVGEACDGMRMVFALVLVVFAFVFSVPFRPTTRIVLIALSPLVALICNIVRLVPTAIVYGFAEPATAEQVHDIAGWLMLPLALVLLLGVVRLMRWLDLPVFRWRMLAT
ncbi:MAG: exosortase/archaeosortase family protein [Phycisphaerae bacterium]|jgi:exosortase|nr:exosortase/archaeosortase family protein [Phycisphaerae bacterium]